MNRLKHSDRRSKEEGREEEIKKYENERDWEGVKGR